MFDTFEEDKSYISSFETLPDIKEWSESQLLKFEKEHLGFYITGHPLAKYEKEIKRLATTTTLDVINCADGSEVSLCGIIGSVKQIATKKGALMAFVNLEDLQGSIEVVVFPEIFKASSSLLENDDPLLVKGKVDVGEKSPKIIANEIMPLAEAEQRLTSSIHIKLLTPGLSKESLSNLKNTLKNSKGNCQVFLHFFIPEQSEIIIAVSEKIKITPNEILINEIEEMFGENTVSLK